MKKMNTILMNLKSLAKVAALYILCIVVLPSCAKENVPGEVSVTEPDGERVISVQFDNSTKVTLNGLIFKFNEGDKIRVSTSSQSEECTVNVVAGRAMFVTALEGALTAVYPSDAAVLGSGSGQPIVSPYFKVPASQDGDVAKAIIAKATIAAGSSKAVFTSQVALFEITPPSGVTSFTIKSLNKIDPATGQRSFSANAEFINTEGTTDAEKRAINVTAVPSGGKAYVALKPGVKLTDLSFEHKTDATHGKMKGIPEKDITAAGKANETAINTKYTIGNTNWHEYVTIGGMKWATMNIGASSATSAGRFFAWGDKEGQAGTPFSKSFNWTNAPFNNGQSDYNSTYFSSVKDTECPGGVLALKNDAAYVNWGGAWRMPVKSEIDALWDETHSLSSSTWTFGTSPNQIQFGFWGYASGTSVQSSTQCASIWTSTFESTNLSRACRLCLDKSGSSSTAGPMTDARYIGHNIRAVADIEGFMFGTFTDKGEF